ncbi:hypothetical protein EVAR_66143_1 [Eumeta japonica]|uniref:Uncharacterized protein n=1 Tax=Eumeta variegata TaxID=151549 RepID=A0A4C1Z065_EUMVA|nr:hypothetical protein EVAR_66143_1 [Eumeta japonica]
MLSTARRREPPLITHNESVSSRRNAMTLVHKLARIELARRELTVDRHPNGSVPDDTKSGDSKLTPQHDRVHYIYMQ